MSPGYSTESYPAFAHIGLRKNPGKNLNQVTCPDRESNPGHLVSWPDTLTVTPQADLDSLLVKPADQCAKCPNKPEFECSGPQLEDKYFHIVSEGLGFEIL
ncbi:hypothetical protein ANN_12493 [Periplaneta americana]|uniref:Uncharacterized protein n=1 Tax=Periplaneta americana TaxID=6978 RepID=A0ABQ8THQ1_PERAM|nr:hypothetical protein ANN_12493 [Periplaneta americana]